MRVVSALVLLSLLSACTTFRGEQNPIFGDYRPMSIEGQPLPEVWSFVSLEKNHVLRLEPEGTLLGETLTVRTGESIATFEKRR